MPPGCLQDAQPLRISGFRQAALAAAAHDHARVWLALREAAARAHTPFEQLVAAVVRVPASELNFPPGEYMEDEALLVHLAGCSRQQLEAHLEPHRLTKWYQDAQAEQAELAEGLQESEGGAAPAATSPLIAALAADSPAAAAALAAGGTAAPLRKDSSTQFVGVSRISGSSQMAAAIQGEQGRERGESGRRAGCRRACGAIRGCVPALYPSGPVNSPSCALTACLLPPVRPQWTASARTWARLRALCRRLWCGTWASFGSACTVRTGAHKPAGGGWAWEADLCMRPLSYVAAQLTPLTPGCPSPSPAGLPGGEALNCPDARLDQDAGLVEQVGGAVAGCVARQQGGRDTSAQAALVGACFGKRAWPKAAGTRCCSSRSSLALPSHPDLPHASPAPPPPLLRSCALRAMCWA